VLGCDRKRGYARQLQGRLARLREGTQTESDLIDFIDNSIASCLRIEVSKALR
jgi:hypothetical protein